MKNSHPIPVKRRTTPVLWITPLTLMLSGAAAPAADGNHPDEAVASRIPRAETGDEHDHATGDWGGFRTHLVERGVHLSAAYTAEVLANVSGGIDQGVVYAGLFEVGLDIDPERLGLWENGLIHASGLYPHGNGLSGDYVGDLGLLSNIDAYDTFRLYEIWYEHRFANDRVQFRFGQLAADESFALNNYSELFVHANFGWPPFISAAVPAPAYPVAAPGAQIRWATADERLYLLTAVFDGDPGAEDVNRSGTDFKLSTETGALFMTELGWSPSRNFGILPASGTYRVGGWVHSADFEDQRLDANGFSLADPMSSGVPDDLSGNWGVYFSIDQPLWAERGAEDQGLGLFVRAGFVPPDRNFIESYADAGFVYTGLIPGRDSDQAGLGISWWGLSRDARRLAEDQNDFGPGAGDTLKDEISVEATYLIEASTWWTIQPVVQWILNPGGTDAAPDAVVIGVRSSIVF